MCLILLDTFRDYVFDRKRIEDLDTLRHEIIHGEGPVSRLPNGENDIWYLEATNMFFVFLLNNRFQVKLNFHRYFVVK